MEVKADSLWRNREQNQTWWVRHNRKILAESDTGYFQEYPCEELTPPSLEVFK